MACCGVGSAATAAAIRSGPDGGREPAPLCQGGVLRTFAWALPRGPLQAVLWQVGDQLFARASRLHNATMRWLQPERGMDALTDCPGAVSAGAAQRGDMVRCYQPWLKITNWSAGNRR